MIPLASSPGEASQTIMKKLGNLLLNFLNFY